MTKNITSFIEEHGFSKFCELVEYQLLTENSPVRLRRLIQSVDIAIDHVESLGSIHGLTYNRLQALKAKLRIALDVEQMERDL